MGYCQACGLWAHPPKKNQLQLESFLCAFQVRGNAQKPRVPYLTIWSPELIDCVRGNNTEKRKQTQSLTLKGLRTMLDLFF